MWCAFHRISADKCPRTPDTITASSLHPYSLTHPKPYWYACSYRIAAEECWRTPGHAITASTSKRSPHVSAIRVRDGSAGSGSAGTGVERAAARRAAAPGVFVFA